MSYFSISVWGNPETKFYSKDALHLATGYRRIVVGKRGPYIEFDDSNINHKSFFIPQREEWRFNSELAFYNEYRSKDDCYIKLYHQKKIVTYADYLIGKYYISPYDVFAHGKCSLIQIKEQPSFINFNMFT